MLNHSVAYRVGVASSIRIRRHAEDDQHVKRKFALFLSIGAIARSLHDARFGIGERNAHQRRIAAFNFKCSTAKMMIVESGTIASRRQLSNKGMTLPAALHERRRRRRRTDASSSSFQLTVVFLVSHVAVVVEAIGAAIERRAETCNKWAMEEFFC